MRQVRFGESFEQEPLADGKALQELGDWLGGFAWTGWGTFTFGPRFGDTGPSGDRAMFHWRRWIERLPAGARPGYFVCVERGRGGRTHLHALVRSSRGVTRKSLWRSWFKRFGRCSILPYDVELGASHYVTKYLVKAPDLWDVESLELQ